MGNTRTRASARAGGLVGLLGLLLTLLIGAVPANAAPSYQTQGVVTGVDFVAESTQSGSRAQISADWKLADDPTPPAGFVLALPPELQGRTDSFPVLDDEGVEMGRCSVTATEIRCDLDADYLAANPRDIGGSVTFWVTVKTEVSETTEVSYDFGEVEATTTITPAPGPCSRDCDFVGRASYKWGAYDTAKDTISWGVVVAAPPTGMAGGERVVVTDRPGPDQEIISARLLRTSTVGENGQGKTRPIDYRTVPTREYTISGDRAVVTFTADEGYFYEVRYTTRPTDGAESDEYTNAADVAIEGKKTTTVHTRVENQGGSGSGSGTNVGRFTITKDVIGATDAVAAVDGVSFSGTYAVTTPGGDVREGTFEVAEGETWTSGEFPRGSVVRLVETTPTAPDTVTWADPVFSENDVVLGSGTTTDVTLTNEATLRTGAFSVAKILDGPAVDRVPADATFTVAYSYPAGPGYEAGSGTLQLPADGTVVRSEQLPVGAVLTLTEVDPAPVDGLTWETAVFSQDTVTIGADQVVAIELTNTTSVTPDVDGTVTERPVPPTEVTPPAEVGPTAPSEPVTTPASAGGLASTGLEPGTTAVITALSLLLAGAALLVVRRRAAR